MYLELLAFYRVSRCRFRGNSAKKKRERDLFLQASFCSSADCRLQCPVSKIDDIGLR